MSSGEEQFKKLGEKVPSYSTYITIKQVPKPDKKGEFDLEYHEKISKDDDWR